MASGILTISVIIALTAFLALLAWGGKAVLYSLEQLKPVDIPSTADQDASRAALEALRGALRDLETRTESSIDILTQAVAEGIDHVERNEKRVRGIVTGAKKRFAAEGYEDPGVNAEFDTLPETDAQPSENQGVLPMHEDMGTDGNAFAGTPWAAVPGIDRINRGS